MRRRSPSQVQIHQQQRLCARSGGALQIGQERDLLEREGKGDLLGQVGDFRQEFRAHRYVSRKKSIPHMSFLIKGFFVSFQNYFYTNKIDLIRSKIKKKNKKEEK